MPWGINLGVRFQAGQISVATAGTIFNKLHRGAQNSVQNVAEKDPGRAGKQLQ